MGFISRQYKNLMKGKGQNGKEHREKPDNGDNLSIHDDFGLFDEKQAQLEKAKNTSAKLSKEEAKKGIKPTPKSDVFYE